ncbi:MAG: DinB family protein [Chloroflexi bacterium]|nr:DinB family protein [Chloroflexota bacterium]
MDAVEYVKRQIAAARRLLDAAMQDVSDEQFNWAPPGVANPIKSAFIHLVAAEDSFIQRAIQGKPRLWEAEGWGEKVGLTSALGRGAWDETRAATLAVAPARAYEQAVRAATDAYLAGLTAEELDRQVSLFGGQRAVADVLALLVVHALGHAGEIAAAKGVQGVKGLPF